MITAERVRHNGALILTALVTDGRDKFYHSRTYFGYDSTEAKQAYRDRLTRDGLVIVRD